MQMTSVWDLLYEVLRCCSLAVEYTLHIEEAVGLIPARYRFFVVFLFFTTLFQRRSDVNQVHFYLSVIAKIQ